MPTYSLIIFLYQLTNNIYVKLPSYLGTSLATDSLGVKVSNQIWIQSFERTILFEVWIYYNANNLSLSFIGKKNRMKAMKLCFVLEDPYCLPLSLHQSLMLLRFDWMWYLKRPTRNLLMLLLMLMLVLGKNDKVKESWNI